jgi:hypothetical protein
MFPVTQLEKQSKAEMSDDDEDELAGQMELS